VWEEQARGYVRPETVHIRPGALTDLVTGQSHAAGESAFRQLLAPLSYEEACARGKYAAFRRGESPCGYMPLRDETLPHFEATFQYAAEALLQHARRAWQALDREYGEARAKLEAIEEARTRLSSDDMRGHQSLNSRRWHARRKHKVALAIHEEDYPQFLYSQAYAGTQGADRLLEVFLTDTVHVVLSRLLFVRLCEDLGLVNKKVSNKGLAVWREFVTNLADRYQDLLEVAFRDASLVYGRLFEATVFDWYTDTDGDLSELLEGILYRLNAFSFRDVDRDLLGRLYQRFLPAAKRKRLGEFYTDDEVVDYILWRTGFRADPHIGSRLVLDPACGSNTFGVRAAVRLLNRFAAAPPQDQIERVREVLVGCDVNPFAVFIAQMSLLFTILPQYRDAKAADPGFQLPPFDVRHANSLLDSRQGDFAGLHVTHANGDLADGACDYVVGNPPYVRNERIPAGDREALAEAYAVVRHKNTDLSAYFIHRALNTWLRPGGRLGFVLSLGLANSEAARRLRRHLRQWRIEEVVSLEWMATELFAGADVVPMLLFVSREAPGPDDTLSIVTGLRERADLQRCIEDEAFRQSHTSVIRRADWESLSPAGDWCLEVTQTDLPILATLRGANWGIPGFGVTLGGSAPPDLIEEGAPGAPGAHWAAFAKGRDVARWGVSGTDMWVDKSQLGRARSAGPWLGAIERDGVRLPAAEAKGRELVAVPRVYVTLSAAVADMRDVVCNDSTVVVLPASASAHAVCALVNSLPARYYHFLALRAAILLRRRSTIYPRTIAELPCPDLDASGTARLDQLSREAHRVCAEVDVDEARLAALAQAEWDDTRPASVLLDFGGWPADLVVEGEDVLDGVVAAGVLGLGPAEVRGDEAGLKLFHWLALKQRADLHRTDAGAMVLPRDPQAREAVVRDIGTRMAARGLLLDRLRAVEDEIDEIVMDGLSLSPDQKRTLRARCEEFPLSETVMRPRYVWSEDRRRQALRRYEDGDRYQ
jgi:hypothetical protein